MTFSKLYNSVNKKLKRLHFLGSLSLLRPHNGVVLEVVTFVLIRVDVVFGRTFSGSESECSKFWTDVGFLTTGAINFSISFWFSAGILVRSDMISLLKYVLISSSFSVRDFWGFTRTCYAISDKIVFRSKRFKLP